MLDSFGTSLSALVAVGGNSGASRSARAKLQWRDRYGRFVDMGRGIKFKVRLSDGTVRSVNGKFVGAIDSSTGQVYVQNDPTGLKDGFYNVKSANAQEILGSIKTEDLAKAGIKLGQGADGAVVSDRSDEEIPNLNQLPFSDAPAGWNRMPDRAGAQVWETEDGAYRLFHSYSYRGGKKTENWGLEDIQRNPNRVQNYKELGYTLQQVAKQDQLPEPDGLNNAQRIEQGKQENADRRTALEAINDTSVPLAQRLAPYDTNGEVAGLVNSGAGGDVVLDALRKNQNWLAIENDLNYPADVRNADQKHRDGVFEKLHSEVTSLKKGALPEQGKPAPAPLPNEPQTATPSVPGQDGTDAGLDVGTFDVAPEGFLIPTGKKTEDGSQTGFDTFITQNNDYLAEPTGKRLLIDVAPDGSVSGIEIATSAPTLDEAKAQAGGIGAPEFYDVAANKTVSNDKNLNPVQEAPNGQSSSPNSGEPKPANAGPEQPVDGGNPSKDQPASPAGPDSAADPATDALGEFIPSTRRELEQRLAYLNRAADRVDPQSLKFEPTLKAQSEVQKALDNFTDPTSSPKEDAPKAAAPEAPTPASDAPAADPNKTDGTVSPASVAKDKAELDQMRQEFRDSVDSISKKLDEVVGQRAPEPARVDNVGQTDPGVPTPAPTSPAPSEPAQVNTPEVPNAQSAVPETTSDTPVQDFNAPFIAGDRIINNSTGKEYEVVSPNVGKSGRGSIKEVLANGELAPRGSAFGDAAFKHKGDPAATPIAELPPLGAEAPPAGEPLGVLGLNKINEGDWIQTSDGSWHRVDSVNKRTRKTESDKAGRQAYTTDLYDVTLDNGTTVSANYVNGRSGFNESKYNVQRPTENAPAPAPVPTPAPASVPNVPDVAPVAPVAPAAPVSAPPAPDVPVVPVDAPVAPDTSTDGGDGLPDTVAELEALAGNMELQIAAARPSRQKVLNEQINKVYDKIDAINGANDPAPTPDVPAPAPVDAPAAPDVAPAAPDVVPTPAPAEPVIVPEDQVDWGVGADNGEFVDVQADLIQNIAAGKDLTDLQIQDVLDVEFLPNDRRAQLLKDVADAPNSANTATKPRPAERQPNNLVQVSPELLAIEQNPNEIIDPNLIFADVRKNHPGHEELPNGDLVLESKTFNGKTYQLVVRRTSRERFFAYILETDASGNRRASRLQNETHSYAALRTKIGRGKIVLREHPNPTKWLNRRRNREILGQDNLKDNAAEEYINGTTIPRSSDDAYNKIVEGIADLANRDNVPRHFLDALGAVGGLKPEDVSKILESVNSRKLIDAAAEISPPTKESHLSVDGTKLVPGQWVDWTDDKKTRPQRDEFGNTIYQRDASGNFVLRPNGMKIALNEPNPDYGKVFRGKVKKLRYKTNDGKYVYSDSTYVAFPELNAAGGRNAQHQTSRVGSQLKIVDNKDAPKSEPFFARAIEKRNQEDVAGVFGLPDPSELDKGVVDRPQPAAPAAVAAELEDSSGEYHVTGYTNVPVPQDNIDAAIDAVGRHSESVEPSALQPGDVLAALDDNGAPVYETVLEVTPNGDFFTRVKVVRALADGHEVRVRNFNMSKLTVLRPNVVPQEQRPIDKPVADLVIGDTINAPMVPGGGKVEGWIGGNDPADRADWIFKVRGKDDQEVYWVRGDEINQPAPAPEPVDPNAPAWWGQPASGLQKDRIKGFMANRKMTDTERAQLQAAINNPNLTKKQASDLFAEFAPRQKVNEQTNVAVPKLLDEVAKNAPDQANIIDEIKGKLAQDLADPAVADKYQGEVVKVIKYGDIKFSGKNAPFENIVRVGRGDLVVGDLIPNGVGSRRSYFQVLNTPDPGGAYRLRFVAQRPDQTAWIGGRLISDGHVFTRFLGSESNVKRPTQKVAKDYYINPANIPAPKPKLGANFLPPVPEPEDPRMAERMAERGQKLVDIYNKGYKVLRGGMGGVDAERADIIEASNGKKYFVKGIKARGGGLWDGDGQMKNELAANRVAQALGISDIQMGYLEDNGNRTIVMDLVEGQPANMSYRDAQNIKTNMWDIPNAWRIGVLDYITKNRDRHDGNWMINLQGQPVPIDHGRVSFTGNSHYSAFADKLIKDLSSGKAPLTSADLLRLKGSLNMLRSEFATMGMNIQFDAMMASMDSLIRKVK